MFCPRNEVSQQAMAFGPTAIFTFQLGTAALSVTGIDAEVAKTLACAGVFKHGEFKRQVEPAGTGAPHDGRKHDSGSRKFGLGVPLMHASLNVDLVTPPATRCFTDGAVDRFPAPYSVATNPNTSGRDESADAMQSSKPSTERIGVHSPYLGILRPDQDRTWCEQAAGAMLRQKQHHHMRASSYQEGQR